MVLTTIKPAVEVLLLSIIFCADVSFLSTCGLKMQLIICDNSKCVLFHCWPQMCGRLQHFRFPTSPLQSCICQLEYKCD